MDEPRRGRTCAPASRQRRSATPAPSIPMPPACCSSASAGRRGCLRFLTVLPKTYTGEVVLGVDDRRRSTRRATSRPRHDMGRDDRRPCRKRAAALTGADPAGAADGVGGAGRRAAPARAGPRGASRSSGRHARSTVHRFDVETRADHRRSCAVEVECSSGTYVRSLAADLGRRLGGGAHLRDLRRTAIGSFTAREATPLDALELTAAGRGVRRLRARRGRRADGRARRPRQGARQIWRRRRPVGGGRRRRRAARRVRASRRHGQARGRARRGRRTVASPIVIVVPDTDPSVSTETARSSPSARTTVCTSVTRRSSPRCARLAAERGCAVGGRHVRPPSRRGGASRVGAEAAHRSSTRSSSCSGDTGVDTTVARPLRRGAVEGVGRGLRASGCSSTAWPPSSSSSARTSTSATSAGATSPCSREMGARVRLRGARAALVPARRRRRRAGVVDRDPPGPRRRRCRLATTLLGRPYEARGVVGRGDQRGRLIGFPTANVEVPSQICLPADGVYAGWYERPNGACTRPRSTSVGARRSTSTPITRCSRPTCSTSTATSTASGRGPFRRLPAQRAQVRRRRGARRPAQPRRRISPPHRGLNPRSLLLHVHPVYTQQQRRLGVRAAAMRRRGEHVAIVRAQRGGAERRPQLGGPDHFAVGAVDAGQHRLVIRAGDRRRGREHASGRVCVDLGLQIGGVHEADTFAGRGVVGDEFRFDAPAILLALRRTGSWGCRRR